MLSSEEKHKKRKTNSKQNGARKGFFEMKGSTLYLLGLSRVLG